MENDHAFDSEIEIEIQNVVVSVNLKQNINLLDITKAFRIVEYNPKKFPGLVFRLKKPKTATLIFSSGKMICTGAQSEELALKAIDRVLTDLKEKNIPIYNEPKITIQNMVASGNLQNGIDLETAADLLDNVMYEPEQFPGLIYRMKDPKTVLLLFASGKLVCTGGKSEKMVKKSVKKIHEILDYYALLYQ